MEFDWIDVGKTVTGAIIKGLAGIGITQFEEKVLNKPDLQVVQVGKASLKYYSNSVTNTTTTFTNVDLGGEVDPRNEEFVEITNLKVDLRNTKKKLVNVRDILLKFSTKNNSVFISVTNSDLNFTNENTNTAFTLIHQLEGSKEYRISCEELKFCQTDMNEKDKNLLFLFDEHEDISIDIYVEWEKGLSKANIKF
ncbi:hypothetical protein ABR775_11430 [Bacillus cereus]|uniref:hypothetical protein n=1 Tax=Bacillus cereus TaxID=1396 RepID=UPI0035585CF8|nr:hypothetical protein [Bacillus cereus]